MDTVTYKAKDQFIATTLLCLGHKIKEIQTEGNIKFFIFEDGENCKEVERLYFNGDLLVNPKELFNSFRDLKSMIYK